MAEIRPDILEQLLAEADWLPRMARGLVSSGDRADDVVQETWVAALRSPPGDARSPRGWLATVARRAVSRMARTARRREHREHAAPPAEPPVDPARLTERVEMQRRVADAVLALDETYRSTVVMRYFEDRTPKEIAAMLSIPAATVRTRIHRALAMLRGRLDDDHLGDRRAWIGVLLPLVGGKPAAAASIGLVATGGLLMSMKTWIGAAVVIALAALAITMTPDSRRSAPASREKATAVGTQASRPPDGPPVPPEVVETPEKPPPVPEAPREATALRGQIVGPDGAPVPLAAVHIALGPNKAVSRARTDKDGRFLVVAPAGAADADLVVEAAGYLPLIRPLGAMLESPGEEQYLALISGLNIVGRLRDETGRPVRTTIHCARLDAGKERVRILSRHHPIRPSTRVVSDEAGRFVIGGLAPGRHRIKAASINFRRGEGSTVDCAAGDQGIELVVYRAIALTLRIHHAGSDRPVTERVDFSVFPESGRKRSGQTGIGKAVIRGLAPGRYHVVVAVPNFRPFGTDVDLSLDEGDVTVPAPLVATAGHGALSGVVVSPGKKSEYRVMVAEFGGLLGFAVDDGGRFEIPRLPAGTYHVRAVRADGRQASRHAAVEVPENARAEVSLSPEPAGRVILRIKGREKCGERGVDFRLYTADGILICRLYFAKAAPPMTDMPLASLVPGTVRVLAVSRDRVIGQTEVAVTVGQDVAAEITLLPTADGAEAAPPIAARIPRPITRPPPAPPPVPAGEEKTTAEVARLTARLSNATAKVRFEAVTALGKLGDAVPVRTLVHVLKNDPDLFIRRLAMKALGAQGRRALSAVPALAQALLEKSPFVRDTANQAIAAISGRAFPWREGMTEKEIAEAAKKLMGEMEER